MSGPEPAVQSQERWALWCCAPPHAAGVVSVDALCNGQLCTRGCATAQQGSGSGSFTFLSGRQWAALLGQVAAPSHARNCMVEVAAAEEEEIAGAGATRPEWSD